MTLYQCTCGKVINSAEPHDDCPSNIVTMSVPTMRYVKGEGEWFHTICKDGKPCTSHRLDAAAVLRGLLPGVTVEIYPPRESDD